MSNQVKIKELSLTNFKGIRQLTVKFNDQVTTISGRNASGKTTIMDAFTWLLFGKDSKGDSDTKFAIKTTDSEGNVIHDLDHEVTGVLEVTDTSTGEQRTVVLRRVYLEEWRVPQGETQRVLKGHHTDYYINDVPMKTKAEYDKRVNEIIPENVFRMITNPEYFLGLHWKEQREMLLSIAGGVTLDELTANNASFAELIAKMEGKPTEDYKREIAAKIAKVKAELSKIPTRKDEVARATPAAPDYAELEAKKAELESQLDYIDRAAASNAEAMRIAYEEAAKIQTKIGECRTKQSRILADAQSQQVAQVQQANARYNELALQLQQAEGEARVAASKYENEKRSVTFTLEEAQRSVHNLTIERNKLRADWEKVNEEEYAEAAELVCPIYRTICRDTAAAAQYRQDKEVAKERFEQQRDERLDKIEADGAKVSTEIEAAQKRIAESEAKIKQIEQQEQQEASAASAKISALKAELASTPKAEIKGINGADIPAWQELAEEIAKLSQEYNAKAGGQTVVTDNSITKRNVTAELDEVKRKLNLRTVIEANQRRMAELDAQATTLAQELADLQTSEMKVEELIKEQSEELERRVNGKFAFVKFRMFKTLVNGETEADCIALVGGTPYNDANNAGQVNAGLDIINALCSFHEVNAPIFVDNAEGVNDFIAVASQLVRLEVTRDELTVF